MKTTSRNLALNTSSRGRVALFNGKKPFDLWTHQDIKYEVIRLKLSNKPCPKIHFDSLDDVPFHILAEKLLISREWHHCNFRPSWFYEIDIAAAISLTADEVNAMKKRAEQEDIIKNRPKWAAFNIYKWDISQSNHEYCSIHKTYGVLYQDSAYFINGKRMIINKGTCEIAKVYEKAPTNRRDDYNQIRKKMRHFEIYC